MGTLLLLASLPLLLLTSLARAVSLEAELLRWVCDRGGGTSVRSGVRHDGVRGLFATCAAKPGDVLLEVPLALTLCDAREVDPKWRRGLPWNVQLALAVCDHRAARTPVGELFIGSWPASPPPLPMDCEADELALSCDRSLEVRAEEAFFWMHEAYWNAREAAEAAAESEAAFPTVEHFGWALQQVWSRCLRISGEDGGKRRVLVPVLDLANHAPVPSAMYACASSARGQPAAVRLLAARAVQPGDEVTITYGQHSSAHFALYYGFVPRANPFDEVRLPLRKLLAHLPPGLLDAPPSPKPSPEFRLRAAAPEPALVQHLAALLPVDAGSPMPTALRAVGSAARSLEAELAAAAARVQPPPPPLRPQTALLVELREERRGLLRRLSARADGLADELDRAAAAGVAAGAVAHARVEAGLRDAAAGPAVYPELDALSIEEMDSWARRRWIWPEEGGDMSRSGRGRAGHYAS